MVIEFTLLGNPVYIEQPQELIGWMGWLVLLGSVIFLLVRWRKINKRWVRLHWGIFIALLVLLALTNLFFVIRLPSGIAFSAQVLPPETKVLTILPFAALSWVLAAGLLGVFPAAALGLLSGTVFALLDTHSPFTPLEFSLLAILLSAAFHQRYRTWVFRLLRHPFFSTILFALIYPVLFILDTTLVTPGSLAKRLDFALTQVELASIVLGIELLVAGVLSEVIAVVFPRLWGFSSSPGTLSS